MNQQILTEAEEALSRFTKGKPVIHIPADKYSDDIKIQKALLLLKEFIEKENPEPEKKKEYCQSCRETKDEHSENGMCPNGITMWLP